MPFSHLPPLLTSTFSCLASWLHKSSALRLPSLLLGILFASGRRTVTSWFRAAAIADDFRPAYTTVCAVGRQVPHMAISTFLAVKPLLSGPRLTVAIDDTPTPRYGPEVEGAGIHHNPSPGPAGEKYVYGHVWVTLAALAKHPDWGTIALPLQAQLYIRQDDLPKLPRERRRPFRTKLQMAAEQLHWLRPWADSNYEELWSVVDGAYAKRPFLRAAKQENFIVVSRLRKDAALWNVPEPVPPEERGPGRPPTYGKERISLAKRAGQKRGWQQVECVQYREKVVKTIKTFLATWRPAGGIIRVVLVQEEDDWLPYFSTNPAATAVEVLEGMADRGSEEQMFKDVKEIEGAGQQQGKQLQSGWKIVRFGEIAFSTRKLLPLNLVEAVMSEIHLSPEQEAEALRLADVIAQKTKQEVLHIARLLVSKADHELLGATEFEIRDRVHRIGTHALETALNGRKKGATEAQA